jgi:hypothetical protein
MRTTLLSTIVVPFGVAACAEGARNPPAERHDASIPPRAVAAPEAAPSALDSGLVRAMNGEGTLRDYELLEAAALGGDYQAQRNLAYQLSGDAGSVPVNQILSCAWRIVIVESGSPSVDLSDTGNLEHYCTRKLGSVEQRAAAAQAKQLQARIAEGASRGAGTVNAP